MGGPGPEHDLVAREVLDRYAGVLGLDDRHRRLDLQPVHQGVDQALAEIFLEHQPVREHVDHPGDPRETGGPIDRPKAEVDLGPGRQEVVRAGEEGRDASHQDRTRGLDREPLAEGLTGSLFIARGQDVEEGLGRPGRGLGQRGEVRVDPQGPQQIPEGGLGFPSIRRPFPGLHRARRALLLGCGHGATNGLWPPRVKPR